MAKAKTGGRKKGTKNQRTQAIDDAVKKGGTLPLDYMLEVMRDAEASPMRRDDMARAAAPYLHARRAPEDKQGKTVPPMIYMHPPLEMIYELTERRLRCQPIDQRRGSSCVGDHWGRPRRPGCAGEPRPSARGRPRRDMRRALSTSGILTAI
jgi:hypothetical protein